MIASKLAQTSSRSTPHALAESQRFQRWEGMRMEMSPNSVLPACEGTDDEGSPCDTIEGLFLALVATAFGGRSSEGLSDRAGCSGVSHLQPLCNFRVEHKMKVQIRFINHTPSAVVRTKLDTALTHAVFVGVSTGKVQQKRWKGIR